MADLAVNYNVTQISSTRSAGSTVTVDNFAAGNLEFPFTLGGVNHWTPAQSYFKVDAAIEGYGTYANKTPAVSDMIAFADNWTCCLWNQINGQMGDQDVSKITQYPAQAASLKKKLYKSYASRHSIGEGVGGDMVSMANRQYHNTRGAPSDLGDGSTQYILKGCVSANIPTAIMYTGAITTGTIFGVGTDFDGTNSSVTEDTEILEGDTLMMNGNKYTVVLVASATSLTVTSLHAEEIKIADATKDFYFIRQNIQNTSIGKNVVSSLYVPPISLFDWGGLLGQGSYKIILTPNAAYQNTAIETKSPLWNAATNGFKLVIKDIKLYIYTSKAPVLEGPKSLNFLEMSVIPKAYQDSTSLTYVVPASTRFITVFAQSSLAGSSNAFPPSSFKALPVAVAKGREGHLSLTGLQLTYGSITKPTTVFDSSWLVTEDGKQVDGTNPQTNRMVQRYFDNYNEMGFAGNNSGVQTIDEWLQSPYYSYNFVRDVTDRAVDLTINFNYSNLATASNIFVVCFYNRTVNYTVAQGQVVAVSSRDV